MVPGCQANPGDRVTYDEINEAVNAIVNGNGYLTALLWGGEVVTGLWSGHGTDFETGREDLFVLVGPDDERRVPYDDIDGIWAADDRTRYPNEVRASWERRLEAGGHRQEDEGHGPV